MHIIILLGIHWSRPINIDDFHVVYIDVIYYYNTETASVIHDLRKMCFSQISCIDIHIANDKKYGLLECRPSVLHIFLLSCHVPDHHRIYASSLAFFLWNKCRPIISHLSMIRTFFDALCTVLGPNGSEYSS